MKPILALALCAAFCASAGTGVAAQSPPQSPPPPSHFAEPAHGVDAVLLEAEEAEALRTAETAVAEMARLARTRDEVALARQDAATVRTIRALVARRKALRRKMDPQAVKRPALSPGGVMSGAGAIGAASGEDAQAQLLAATRQMQETQMSFNLQYLQLQGRMQGESGGYTAVSDLMKTRHDTVKNAIANIR